MTLQVSPVTGCTVIVGCLAREFGWYLFIVLSNTDKLGRECGIGAYK